MLHKSLWSGEWKELRGTAQRVLERRHQFEDRFARSYAEMRARKQTA